MDFLKKVKELLAKGWATDEEKKTLTKEFEAQDEDVKELSLDNMTKVKDLPEEDPEEGDVEKEVEKSIKKVFANEKETLEKSVLEKVKDTVLSDVQKILDEHKDKMKRKVGAYSTEVKKDARRKVTNRFLRHGLLTIIGGSDTKEFMKVKAEMTTDDTATPYSGYITDSILSAEIRHLTTEYGVAAREFNTVSFTQSSYKANNLATDVAVFWVDEAGSIQSTQAVLGQETLELKKLATIVALTRELLQEQEIDFISFLGSRVAEAFAKAEDDAFFIGDGTSTYGSFTGLLINSSVNEVVMDSGDGAFGDISVEYLREMQDSTPQGALANAKYYMHRSILTLVRNLREDAVSAGDNKGAFLYTSPSGSDPRNIDNYPIVLVESMPARGDSAVSTSFVLFGDLKKATIRGTRGGIIVDKFDAGSVQNITNNGTLNLITTDRQAVRWITQVGYIVILPTAVTKLTTAAASN